MKRRNVTQSEVEEALANISITYNTPEDSTCIVGTTASGRALKIWIVGTEWPPSKRMILKSVAGRDEDDD